MQHPYMSLPDKAFWRRSVAKIPVQQVDPVGEFNIRLQKDTKVATAGSCFAQHIARHLRVAGFNYYVAETGHPLISASVLKEHNYGLFSARYGNIYTAKQLLQLFQRACGTFQPKELIWKNKQGNIVDPFRPTIQPGGFLSLDEMLIDREQHLAAVKTMFKQLDVFIFTLGLTECWRSCGDGAVFPVCPGVVAGEFHVDEYSFHNQDIDEIIVDMTHFLTRMAEINPNAQVILTVSPVPLAATAEPDVHVLSATTYSKSVLRVAAEKLRKQFKQVNYFPSYEIITGSYNRGQYYSEDLRNVTEAGVEHVMSVFLNHAAEENCTINKNSHGLDELDAFHKKAAYYNEVECDEAALDKGK